MAGIYVQARCDWYMAVRQPAADAGDLHIKPSNPGSSGVCFKLLPISIQCPLGPWFVVPYL